MASTVFPSFRHSVDDEPTSEWTVEEVFQWALLQSHKATDEKYEQLSQALHQQLAAGEQDIWNVHQQVLEEQQSAAAAADADNNTDMDMEAVHPHEQQGAVENTENQGPSLAAHGGASPVKSSSKPKSRARTNKNNADKSSNAHSLHIDIIGGMYMGQSFDLKPKPRAPCMVGRSQGKRFKDRGISLAQDLEVSTTHGKFQVIHGILYFTDTGSTNGTKVETVELEPDTPYPLTNGLVLTCGQSLLKVTLPE